MSNVTTALRNFWNDEEGATMAEYALLLGLIALALIVAIQGFRGAIGDKFNKATTDLNNA